MPKRKLNPTCQILILFGLTVLLTGTPGCSSEEKTVSFQLHGSEAQSANWQIRNKGQKAISFSLQADSIFFLNRNELAQHIKQTASAPEAQARLAWQLISNLTFPSFHSNARYIHAPEILINSLGHGYCDDMASALVLLWQALGFEARVWKLEGHVVPEVLIGGHWQVYDPDLGLYFQDIDKNPLSVDAIARGQAHFVAQESSPFLLSSFPPDAFHLDKYRTVSDNSPAPWFTDSVFHEDLVFQLPAGSVLRCCDDNPQDLSAPLLRIDLPKGSKGLIQVPLLPSKSAVEALPPRSPSGPWNIKKATTEALRLHFHVNPILLSITEITIKSSDTSNLEFSELTLTDTSNTSTFKPPFTLDLQRYALFISTLNQQPGLASAEKIPLLFEVYHKKAGSWSGKNQKQFNKQYQNLIKSASQSPAYQQGMKSVINNSFSLFLAVEYYLINYPAGQLFQLLKEQS
jgi:hypothetical protein